MWSKNIAGRFFGLVTKHACDRQTDGRTDRQTDRETDRQNYDSQDRASIAASRGKNSGVGTPFPLVQKCLWERRSHTKMSMGTAFPLVPAPLHP